MKAMLVELCTGPDGKTFDPARVIGYGAAVLGVLGFLFCAVWSVIHEGKFDAASYGAGFGAVCAGIMAVGIGVGAKSHTEPKA